MKKLLLMAFMIAAVFLLTSGVALAGESTYTVTCDNPPPGANDVHFIIYDSESVVTITTATVTGYYPVIQPDGTSNHGVLVPWSATTTTETRSVGGVDNVPCPGVTGAGDGAGLGSVVITVSESSTRTPFTAVRGYYWTKDGVRISPDIYVTPTYVGSGYGGFEVETTVQRSIKISIANSMLDFGRIKFGIPSTQSMGITVSSNDYWSLFVSGVPDLSVSHRDIFEFLGVSIAGGLDTGIGGLADEISFELITDGEPTVESSYNLDIVLDPDPLTRPDKYRGSIFINVAQHY